MSRFSYIDWFGMRSSFRKARRTQRVGRKTAGTAVGSRLGAARLDHVKPALERLEDRTLLTQTNFSLFDTGVDGSGNPLAGGSPDPHYIRDGGGPATVVDNTTATGFGWVVTGGSRWVSRDAGGGSGGDMAVDGGFNIGNINPSTTLTLSGSFAADDDAFVQLNGNTIATAFAAFGAFVPFSTSSFFVAGGNALRIVAQNTGGGVLGAQFTGLTLTVSGAISFNGTAGADTFTLTTTGANSGTFSNSTTGQSFSFTGATSFTINGSTGNDTLSIVQSAAAIGFGITYNGGGNTGDALTIGDAPGTATTITHTFTNNNDGSVNIDGTVISYTGLAPVTDNMDAANRVFTFNAGPETISLTDAALANMTIDSNVGGEMTTFANPTTSLTINAGTGDDIVNINSLDATYAGSLTVNGNANTDTVNLAVTTAVAISTPLSVSAETIGQTNGLSVTGTTTLDATATGTITLNNAANNFVGDVTVTNANSATLRDANAVQFAAVTAGSLTVTAGAGITDDGSIAVSNDASFSGNTITLGSAGETTDFGNLTFNSAGVVTIQEDSATSLTGTNTAGILSLVSSGAITDATGVSLTVTANASFDGTSITLGDQATDTVDFGSLTYNGTGAVAITEDSPTQLTGTNTANSLTLISAGAIDSQLGTSQSITNGASFSGTSISLAVGGADTLSVGGNATFMASGGGAIGVSAPGTVNFGTLTFTTTGLVNITEDSSTAFEVTSSGGTITVNSGGAMSDSEVDAANEITGTDLTLTAVGGVGVFGQRIHIAVTNLDVSNTVGGGTFVTDTAGGLTLSNLGGPNTNAVSSVGGGEIRAMSPLTIAADAITSGGMTYTADDSAGAGDNLTIIAGVNVQDTTAGLIFNVGDNFVTGAGTTIQAASTVVINLDVVDADGGTGSTATLNSGAGILTTGTGTTINGGAQADTINLAAQTNSSVHIVGGAPTLPLPADTLNLTLPVGTTESNLIPTRTFGFAANIVPPGVGAVSYVQIETYNPTGFTANNVRVRGDQSTDAILNAAPFSLGANEDFSGDALDDTTSAQRPDATNLALQFTDGANTADTTVPMTGISSLTFDGTADDNLFLITETANGLPNFGGVNPNGHTNATLTSRTGSATVPSIHLEGNGGFNLMRIDLSAAGAARHVIYATDTNGGANSGAVQVADSAPSTLMRLSFDELAPSDLIGPGVLGGDLLVDASSIAAVTSLAISDDTAANSLLQFGAAVAGASFIDGNSTFEDVRFRGYTRLIVVGGGGAAETIDLIGLDLATTLTSVILDGDNATNTDGSADTLIVRSLPGTVTASLLGGGGDDLFRLDSDPTSINSGTVAGILGQVLVSTNVAGVAGSALPGGLTEEGGTDALYVDNFDGPAANVVFVDSDGTSPFVEGITGSGSAQDVRYNFAVNLIETVSFTTANNFGDTVNVQFTSVGSTYFIDTGSVVAADDTVNISDDAPANAGVLDDIDGQVNIAMGPNTGAGARDTINASDFGDTAGDIYNLTLGATIAGVTDLTFGDGAAATDIRYNVVNTTPASTTPTAALQATAVETFSLVGANALAANNTYNINNTTATVSNTISDGDATVLGAGNNGTFNIQADAVQGAATNTFNGFDGNDDFNLNFASDTSISALPGTTFVVNGGLVAADPANRDRVDIDTTSDTPPNPRTLGFTYASSVSGDLNVTGLGTPTFIDLNTVEQVNYVGDVSDDDVLTATAVAGNDDILSVTPRSSSEVNVYLNGNPFLGIDYAAPFNSPGTNNPGLAGAANNTGPDINAQGLLQAGFTVAGNGGDDDRLVVNAPTEALSGAGGSAAWAGNAVGSSSVVVAVGSDLAYDTIAVTDTAIQITNPNFGGAMLRVNYANSTFSGPTAADAEVTVNSGEESDPLTPPNPQNIADDVTVTFSTNYQFQVNGGAPPLPGAPPLRGDRLTLLGTTGAINVYSDLTNPPNVVVTADTAVGVSQPVNYNNIEILTLRPGDPSRTVNILGDNNNTVAQIDEILVSGGTVNALGTADPVDPDSHEEFWLLLNGSNPIAVQNVRFLNIFGFQSDDDVTLDPYADNTPLGWGIHVNVDGGAGDDDLFYGNVERDTTDQPGIIFLDDAPDGSRSGVSENVKLAPTGTTGAGQVRAINATSGSDIVTVDFTTVEDASFFFNEGTAGDTDTLTIQGTDIDLPGSDDVITANFSATGDDAGPWIDIDLFPTQLVQVERFVRASANAGAAPTLLPLQLVTMNLLGGGDLFSLTPRTNASSTLAPTTINVDGGLGGNQINISGTQDADDRYTNTPGTTNDSGLWVLRLSNSPATSLNYSNNRGFLISGGGGTGIDTLDMFGTPGNDHFDVTGTTVLSATAQVDKGPNVLLNFIGSGGSDINLLGDSGDDLFSITHFSGSVIDDVNIIGGPPSGSDAVQISGTTDPNSICYTATGTDAGTIDFISGGTCAAPTAPVTNYILTEVESVLLDALDPATFPGDTLAVTNASATITTGTETGSGRITSTDVSNQQLLPLDYRHVETPSNTASTLVVQGTGGDDRVTVTAAGVVEFRNATGGIISSFNAGGFNTLVLNVLGGDDSISPASSALFTGGILLIGGDNGPGSDLVTVADPNPTVDFTTNQVSNVVGGPLTLTGVETLTINGSNDTLDAFTINNYGSPTGVQTVNLNAGDTAAADDNDTVDVSMTTGPDTLDYTPLSATSARLARQTTGPVINLSNFDADAGELTVAGNGNVDSLNVIAPAGNDRIDVTRVTNNAVVQVFANGNPTGGVAWVAVDFQITAGATNLDALVVQGAAGNDRLVIDNTGGALTFANGIHFDGGAGTDSLVVQGATAATSSTYTPGPAAGGGTLVHDYAGVPMAVTFAGLEPVIDLVAGPLVVNGNGAANAISYSQGSTAARGLVAVDNLETIEFENKTSLTINGLGGNDTISFNNGNQPTGLTTVTANGGDSPAGDTLVVNGGIAANLTVSATQVTNAATGITINYATIESITAVEGISTGLTVTGSADYLVTPGAQVDEGTINSANTPVAFRGYGAGNTITLTGAGTLTLNGTDGNDAFTVAAGGNTNITGRVTLDPNGQATLTLNGLDGDDSFTVASGHGFATVNLAGGDPSASDVATLTGDAATPAELILGLPTPSVTGAGLGTVNLTSVEFATVNNGVGAIDINGTANPDTIVVSPTGANTAQVQVNGLSPLVTTNNTGPLTIDEPNGGSDGLTVNGTAAGETIAVARGAITTTVSVGTLKVVSVTTVNIEQLTVAAGDGNDTVNVTGTGGPALNIVGGDQVATDTLTVTLATAGGAATTVTPGSTPDSGTISDVQDGNLGFSGIEAITITGAAATDDLAVQGTHGDDSIAAALAGGATRVWVNDRAVVTFATFDALDLQGRFGNDAFSITPMVGVTVTAQGNDPTGSDSAVVNISAATTVTGLLVDGATVQMTGAADVILQTIEHVSIAGDAGNDALTVQTPAATATTTTLTPGPDNDLGSLQVGTLVPLSFGNLGGTGSLVLDDLDAAANDTLVYNGTSNNDAFGVPATAILTLNSRITVDVAGDVTTLTLDGLDGDDTFTVASGHGIATINLAGGNPSASDVATLNGSGAAAAEVNIGDETPQVTGAGLGTVNLTGVELLNMNNGAAAIEINGTANPDSIVVSPTGTNTTSLQMNGLAPVVNTNNTGTLLIDEPNGGSDNLTVNGTAAGETIAVARAATTTVTVGALKVVSLTVANIEQLTVAAEDGNDTIDVTGTGGPQLTVNGGGQASVDTLTITNTAVGGTTVTPGASDDSGTIATPDTATNTSFAGIEAVTLTAAAAGGDTLTMLGTHGNDTMAVGNLGGGDRVWVNARAVVTFSNFETVTLNGRFGDDKINVSPGGLAVLITSINVIGGDPTASDELVVNGTAAGETIAVDYDVTATTGTVTVGALPAVVTIDNTVESLAIDGAGGGDTLTVVDDPGGAAADLFTLTPGATFDSGVIQTNARQPLRFENLGAGGITLNGGAGGSDTIAYNGTANNDAFSVSAAGVIDLVSNSGSIDHINVTPASIETLILNGLDGDDTFTLNSGYGYTTVNLSGGNPSASDVATLNGSGAATAEVNLGDETPQVTGAGLGTVNLTSVEFLNMNNGAAAIEINGTPNPDSIVVSPTGTNTTSLQMNGLAPVVNTNNTGTLLIDEPNGGSDNLTVNGTAAGETIAVARAATTTVTVGALKVVSLTVANIEQLTVAAGDGNDTIDVTGTGGSQLTVNGGGQASVDTLTITNTAVGGTTVTPGASDDSGTIATPDTATNTSFLGIEAVTLTAAVAGGDTLTMLGTHGNDTMAVGNLGGGDRVWVNARAVVTFTNFETVTLNGRFGDDKINVSPGGLAVGITSISVIGGDPTASDELVVNGTAAGETIAVDYDVTATTGTVTVGALPAVVTFDNTVESLVINGAGGGDTLSVTDDVGGANADVFTLTPGVTADSGQLQTNARQPLQFLGLGATGQVTLLGGGGTDNLVYNGTDADDVFTVLATSGTVDLVTPTATVIDHVNVLQASIEVLTLNGLSGDDTFNVTGTQPYTAINLQGGDPSASDVANLNGNGTVAIFVTLGSSPPTTTDAVATGGGLGTVTMSGVEFLNVNAATQAVTVTATEGDDTVVATPLGGNTGVIVANGRDPVLNYLNVAANTVSIDPSGGQDTLVVNGTSVNDGITVNVPAGSVNTGVFGGIVLFTVANTEAITANALQGNDLISVITGAIPVFVDGGDPIGPVGDTLDVTADASSLFVPGPEGDSGGFNIDDGERVSFDHIEAATVRDSGGPANVAVTVRGTNGDDDITFQGTATNNYTISVNDGPAVQYLGSTSAQLEGLSGDDDIDVDVNVAALGVAITVFGGLPEAGSDVLTIQGVDATDDQPSFTPATEDSGAFTLQTLASPIAINDVELVVYDGEADDEDLSVSAAGRFVHTPGAAVDAGTVRVDSLLPLQYEELGAGGTVLATGTGGSDTLVALGTNSSDVFAVTFTLANAIDIDLTSDYGTHVDLLSAGVENYRINSLDGDDDFNLTGGENASGTFQVVGGSPGIGSDSLNLISVTADGIQTVTITPDATESDDQDVTGFGSLIDVMGVELITYTGADTNDTLIVNPGVGDNTVRVDRGVGADRVVSDSLPQIEFTALSVFRVDANPTGANGADVVTFATWFLAGATSTSYEMIGGTTDSLVIEGVDGGGANGSDNMQISNPAGAASVQIDNRRGTLSRVTETSGNLGRLEINLLGGDDLLFVELGGLELVQVPIMFDGGQGSDMITVSGTPAAGNTAAVYSPGPDTVEGREVQTVGAQTMIIDFANLEPFVDLVPGTLTVNGTDRDNAIDYRDGIFVPGTRGVVSVDEFEFIEFSNKTALTINAGAGNDQVTLNHPGAPTSLAAITVNGNVPTGNGDVGAVGPQDRLVVQDIGGGTPIVYTPGLLNGGASSTITGAQVPPVTANTTEWIHIVGAGGNVGLEVVTTGTDDIVNYTPGPTRDSGTVRVQSLPGGGGITEHVPMSFSNLGTGGSVTFTVGVGTDTLVYNGTNSNDQFTVAATTGTIDLVTAAGNHVDVLQSGLEILTLDGFDGDDTFNVTGPQPTTTINLFGGNPSATDVVNLFGNNTAVTVTLGLIPPTAAPVPPAPAIDATVVGGGLGTVNLSSDEFLNLTPGAGANLATVQGAGGHDTLVVSSINASTATVELIGADPFVTLLGIPSFTAGGGSAGIDLLNPIGTNTNDTIAVTTTSVQVTDIGGSSVGNPAPGGTGGPAGPVIFFDGNIDALYVDGGLGNDLIQATSTPGIPTTLAGGEGNDSIIGAAGEEFEDGGRGNDSLQGGGGNDTLQGGEGNDRLDGDGGADEMFGGDGSDLFIWDPGDGSDLVEGGSNEADVLAFNGSAAPEVFNLFAHQNTSPTSPVSGPARTRLTRDVGLITMDIAGVEQIDINAAGGADTIIIGRVNDGDGTAICDQVAPAPVCAAPAISTLSDLTTTDVNVVNVNLDATPGSGTVDGSADAVFVDGRPADDNVFVSLSNGIVTVAGLKADVKIRRAESTLDRLTVRGNEGDDAIKAAAGVENQIQITFDGGIGNDSLSADAIILGGPGDDSLTGGPGNDLFFGHEGNDTMFGGTGNDTLSGGSEFDTIIVHGTQPPASERIDLFQTNATTLNYQVTDLGGGNLFVLETDTLVSAPNPVEIIEDLVEEVRIEAGAGADIIRVATADALFDDPTQSLRIHVVGGDDATRDRLAVIDDDVDDLVLYRKGELDSTGTVTVGPGNLEPFEVVFEQVEVVQFVDEFGNPLNDPGSLTSPFARLAVFKHDPFEFNDDRFVATHLGAGDTINVDPTIDPGFDATPLPIVLPGFGLPADQDWYRFVVETTGTLDLQVYFEEIPTLGNGRPGLPDNGNLDIQVYDVDGTLIAGGGPNFGINDGVNDVNIDADAVPDVFFENERIRIPAVAGQTYFLRVFGRDADLDGSLEAINNYNMTVINEAPPVPFDIELDDLPLLQAFSPFEVCTQTAGLPAGEENSDSGRSQFDNVTCDRTPTIRFRIDEIVEVGGLVFLEDVQGNVGGFPNNPPDEVIRIPFNASQSFNTVGLAAGFRVPIFEEGQPQQPSSGVGSPRYGFPQEPVGFATPLLGAPGVWEFTFPALAMSCPNPDGTQPNIATAGLCDGSHFISAKIQIIDPATILPTGAAQTGYGERSVSMEIVVDAIDPNISFGDPGPSLSQLNDGLDPETDSGVIGQPNTNQDEITNDTTPTFWGWAEANTVIRLWVDLNGDGLVTLIDVAPADGVLDAGSDRLLAETVAVPRDGTNQFPNGYWEATSNVDLNDPALFAEDGRRLIMVTAEDLAGNISPPQLLEIFIDTRGPQVTGVFYDPIDPLLANVNVFNPKPVQTGPTPLTRTIRVDLQDLPARFAQLAGIPGGDGVYGFQHQAANEILAEELGNFKLVGDQWGEITLVRATFTSLTLCPPNVLVGNPTPGTIACGFVTLDFEMPLPDDRYTLTVYDRVKDEAGNALDGESNTTGVVGGNNPADLPSGDEDPGQTFQARFTVDTRPEVGTFCCGSWYIDLNGNLSFDDPNNHDSDFTNGDIVYKFGLPGDFPVVGDWDGNGFDEIGVYGRRADGFRFELDLNGNGAFDPGPGGDVSFLFNALGPNSGGRPVAGAWNPGQGPEDHVAVFTGTTWFVDLSPVPYTPATVAVPATPFVTAARGRPIAADFNGDGDDDAGLFQRNALFPMGVFQLDFATDDNFQVDTNIVFGFNTVFQIPVAGDWDGDRDGNIGLFVTDRNGQFPHEAAEYYLDLGRPLTGPLSFEISNSTPLMSFGVAPLAVDNAANPGDTLFQPPPTGGLSGVPDLPFVFQDIFSQFGDEKAEPIVGNFDPPTADAPAPEPLVRPLERLDDANTPGDNATPVFVWDRGGQGTENGTIGTAMDRDVFRFIPTESGRVAIDAKKDGSGLDTYLSVLSSTGRRLARNANYAGSTDSHVELSVTAGESYFIVVNGTRRTLGDYEMLVDYVMVNDAGSTPANTGSIPTNPGPTGGNSSSPRTTVDDHGNTAATGTAIVLDSTGARAGGTIGESRDQDVFNFTASVNGRLELNVAGTSGGVNTVVEVFDSAGRLLARNDNADATTTDSRVTIDVYAGQSYSVLVRALGKRRGDYTAAFDWLLTQGI